MTEKENYTTNEASLTSFGCCCRAEEVAGAALRKWQVSEARRGPSASLLVTREKFKTELEQVPEHITGKALG